MRKTDPRNASERGAEVEFAASAELCGALLAGESQGDKMVVEEWLEIISTNMPHKVNLLQFLTAGEIIFSLESKL